MIVPCPETVSGLVNLRGNGSDHTTTRPYPEEHVVVGGKEKQ